MAPLTSVTKVRDYLQKQGADTAQDLVVSDLIDRASKLIMRETGREFAPATASAVRTFEWGPRREPLSLVPYDLRSVTTIKLDSDTSSPITVTTDQYRLQPTPARDGVYTAIEFDPYFWRWRYPWNRRRVEVTGAWGFAEVPDDVEHWCVVQVAQWLRRDVAAFERTFSLDEGRLERPQALASAVRAGLADYRRPEIL